MIVPFGHVLIFAGILFLMGIFCAVVRRNLIMMVLGVEIMLNAASITFVGAALRWQHLEGQVFALFYFSGGSRRGICRAGFDCLCLQANRVV